MKAAVLDTISPRKYKAFISYSHSDGKIAEQIHRRLENYRTPRRLVGTKNRDGTVPARLFPIFRDRVELPTSADLGGAIRSALENSGYLVVLCSPASARSMWVGKEIELFKQIHGESRVIAVLIEGEPDESFPKELKYRVAPDGSLTDVPTEPIAADIRPQKDGFRLGCMKVLAGVLGVNLDDLIRRDQRRRAIQRGTIVSLATVFILGAMALAFAWQQAREKEAIQADLNRGANQLRAGAVFEGAQRFLLASERAGRSLSDGDKSIATDLRGRLTSLAVALNDLEEGQVFNWGGKAYLPGATGPMQIADEVSESAVRTDKGIVIASIRGVGLIGVDTVNGTQLWLEPLAAGWILTDAWQDPKSTAIHIETAYYGTTNGSYQSSNFWLDPITGRLADKPVNAPLDKSQLVDVLFTVNALAWPRFVDESTIWTSTGVLDSPPFLPSGTERSLFDSRGATEDQSLGELFGELGPIFRRLAYSCGEFDFLAGVESQGNSGGSWASCTAKTGSPFNCETYEYIGILSQIIPAPDCTMAVSTGVNLKNQNGILIAMADGHVGKLDNAAPFGMATLGTFSPRGTRFAVTDGGSVIQVFKKVAGGLRKMSSHDAGSEVLLVSFMGESGIAFVTASGELRSLNIIEQSVLWPPYKLEEQVVNRLSQDDRTEAQEPVAGRLVATAEGDRLALLVQWDQLDSEDTKPNAFARFFDASRGIPLGNNLPLNVATKSKFEESLWKHARLTRNVDGQLILSFAPFGAFIEQRPINLDVPIPLLTGRDASSVIAKLP